jgi:hypothetical protein
LGDLVVLQFNVDDDSAAVQRGDDVWVGWLEQHSYQLADGGHGDGGHDHGGHNEEG